MEDRAFYFLLNALERSPAGYRRVRKGVKKRLSRRMRDLGCRTVADYLARVQRDPEERAVCDTLLLVTITRFFRDRPFWDVLNTHVFPRLAKKHPQSVRIWSAAILWRMSDFSGLAPVRILATDLSPENIERARRAVYPRSSFREATPETVQEAFDRSGKDRFSLKAAFRECVSFQAHRLGDPPPETGFHFIFLRNSILTYLNEPGRTAVFRSVLPALSPGGFLAIGAKERLPEGDFGLLPVFDLPYLFHYEP